MALLAKDAGRLVVAPAEPRVPRLKCESIWDLMQRDLPTMPTWIGPAVLPKGGKWLLGGQAKIGKSFLCMEICRAIATGGKLFGTDTRPVPEPARVLYVEQEVGIYGVRDRALKMMRDESPQRLQDNFLYVSREPQLKLDDDAGLELLDELIEVRRPNVVVLDPASRLIKGDQRDNMIIIQFWSNLDRLIRKYADLSLSFVVAHHFRKPKGSEDGDDPYSPYNFTGGADWFNAPDTATTCLRATRQPGARKWLLSCMDTTRQGWPGELLYLELAPDEPNVIREVPADEAEAMLAAITKPAGRKSKASAKSGAFREHPGEDWNDVTAV